jgi:ABC-type sugar transport system substrate-binding protein
MPPRAFGAVLLAGLMLAAGCGGTGGSGERGDVSIAAVIKGLDNPFFVTMREGLEATARAREVRLRVRTAGDLYDTAGQAASLQAAVAEEAACYIVNPINRANLVQPLGNLPEGTPVVNIDSAVDLAAAEAVGATITTYIGTDNEAGGRLGADAVARLVDTDGRVVLVTGLSGDIGSAARARGFRSGVHGRFRTVHSVAADFDRARAERAAAELLRNDPQIDAFFAVNDEMALGIARAVRAAGRSGDVAVVGFDGTGPALTALKRGSIAATVSQYPYTIGQLAVEACLAAIDGKAVPPTVDAPVQLITEQNVARAVAAFPRPVEPFDDPLAELLDD